MMNYHNKAEWVTIGGKKFYSKSGLERKVARYLQLLKEGGAIREWDYEFMRFEFPDDSWLIDFTVCEKDGNFYHIECKGHFEAKDRKKLKLLFKYYPQARVLYVFKNDADRRKMKTAINYLTWRQPILLSDLTKNLI